MGLKITANKEVRKQVFNKFQGKCAYCGTNLNNYNFQIDHIIPLRRGMDDCVKGDNSIENFNPCCASCNSSKSCMDLEKWRIQLQRKVKVIENESSAYRIAKRFGSVIENNEPIMFHFEKFI